MIGLGSNIVPNLSICADCLIGAGSTVVKNVTITWSLHRQSGEEEGMREGEDKPPEESSHAVRRPAAAGCRRRWSAAR